MAMNPFGIIEFQPAKEARMLQFVFYDRQSAEEQLAKLKKAFQGTGVTFYVVGLVTVLELAEMA